MLSPPLLSCFQAAPLLRLRGSPTGSAESHESSLDLGLTSQSVEPTPEGITFACGIRVSWTALEKVHRHDKVCFRLDGAELEPVRHYSEETGKTYQLMPTASSPALLISGFVMHRFRDVSPHEGAARMVRALGPLRGRLLDTATGLGYAAISAAQQATSVVTVELDPGPQAIARQNPWCQALFSSPTIQQQFGDSSQLIHELPAASFDAILHDPPAINLAGELYAESFYRGLHRVLSHRGRLFHYVGDPKSASGGRVTQGVIARLRSAGFGKITPRPEAFGVVATKSR